MISCEQELPTGVIFRSTSCGEQPRTSDADGRECASESYTAIHSGTQRSSRGDQYTRSPYERHESPCLKGPATAPFRPALGRRAPPAPEARADGFYHEEMERVAIVGAAGAGKSVLAERLGRRTGLPVVHLDPMFWRDGWTPAPRDEAVRALAAAIRGDRWIVDGNFLEAGEPGARFDRADTVIFLDLPRRTCLWRILTRRVRDRGGSRPDLPEGCQEGLDLPLVRWIWSYPETERPHVLALLDRLAQRGVDVHRLRSPAEVQRFLDTL
jgi:adenylate kinase family enzyme